jgi:hypothetical protein
MLEKRVHNVPVASVQEELREVIDLIDEIERDGKMNATVKARLLAVLGYLLTKLPVIESAIKSLLDD